MQHDGFNVSPCYLSNWTTPRPDVFSHATPPYSQHGLSQQKPSELAYVTFSTVFYGQASIFVSEGWLKGGQITIKLTESRGLIGSMTYEFPTIGTIESCFREKNGTPRQPGIASGAKSRLRLRTACLNNPRYSLEDLEGFSHIWVLFVFHLDDGGKSCSMEESAQRKPLKSKVTPPRLKGKKVGLFATRSPHRPAPIGLSLVKLEKVQGEILYLSGADLVNGTPILDIKPYLPNFDTPTKEAPSLDVVRVPDWVSPETALVSDLNVCLTARARNQLGEIFRSGRPTTALIQNEKEMIQLLGEILSGDPRSLYRKDKCSDRLYFLELDGLHFTSWFDDGEEGELLAEVLRVRLTDTFDGEASVKRTTNPPLT